MIAQETGLSDADMHAIRNVFSQFPAIQEAILYGSRAKGTHRPGSDIDLTLKGEHLTHQTLLDIEWMLDDLLLPYKFDISLYSQLDNQPLIEHITRAGKLFYRAN